MLSRCGGWVCGGAGLCECVHARGPALPSQPQLTPTQSSPGRHTVGSRHLCTSAATHLLRRAVLCHANTSLFSRMRVADRVKGRLGLKFCMQLGLCLMQCPPWADLPLSVLADTQATVDLFHTVAAFPVAPGGVLCGGVHACVVCGCGMLPPTRYGRFLPSIVLPPPPPPDRVVLLRVRSCARAHRRGPGGAPERCPVWCQRRHFQLRVLMCQW
jgi:hypothetical protein